jgi:DNA-binding transcriptional ArsR family regulator
MADRSKSPAYRALPSRSARRMLATITKLAANNGGVATISYTDLRLPPHGFSRPAISASLKVLIATGLIDAIEPGPRLIGRYRLSDRWRTVSEADAKRLAREARAIMPQRRFERRRTPVAPQPAPETHVEPVEPVQFMERRPSMPTLRWLASA